MLRALAVVAAACAHPPVAAPAPHAPLTFTYLGVAGWTISDGTHTVVVDPYFTREQATSDAAAVKAHEPAEADLIVIGHAHPDHALDAPAVSLATGAPILAPVAALAAARDAGVADDHLIVAAGGEDYAFDGFSVRVIPSLHSAIGFAAGDDVATFAYLIRFGETQVLVFDTANYVERELEGIHPDVAIVATGLRDKITDYSCRLMKVLGQPPLVLPTHFDDWHAPAGTPLDADTQADLGAFADEIHRCAPATKVIVPTAFAPLRE